MANRVTEIKQIKIDAECKENPVYIAWIGTNGGWNYWLFERVQTEVLQVESEGEYNPYVEDLETAIGNSEFIGKSALPQLIVGAYVDLEDVRGLKGLMMTPAALILTNIETWQTEGCKWIRVKVMPETFKVLQTNQTKTLIELTLELPFINIQNQ